VGIEDHEADDIAEEIDGLSDVSPMAGANGMTLCPGRFRRDNSAMPCAGTAAGNITQAIYSSAIRLLRDLYAHACKPRIKRRSPMPP